MEEWRAVVGYEGIYEVSDQGRVRSIGRKRGMTPGRIRKQGNHKQGYRAINLDKNGITTGFLVHRLVAVAFIGPIPDGYEVNHIDGHKMHNVSGNLEYVTRRQNLDHAMRLGILDNRGERNSQAKLTIDQVCGILAEYKPQVCGYKQLGKKYGVTWGAIRSIIKRRTWVESIGARA